MAERAKPDNANKGFNIKTFLIVVVLGTLAILVFLFFFVLARGKKDIPKVNQPNPNSRLALPLLPNRLS